MKSDAMELNRKTAMDLWKKQFGKTDKAVDYAGREILKSAYDDRGSAYGWNVDHILPRSRGGKTAEHNLICCHMETNSEKADKFPCFTANDTRFEIRKVQNHYEIVALGDDVDFFDAGSGVAFWERCCDPEEAFWEGYVTISFDPLRKEADNAFVSFLLKLFEGERCSLEGAKKMRFAVLSRSPSRRNLLLRVHGVNRIQDIQRVLDLCVLLNTYMKGFFCAQGLIEKYSLYYDIEKYPTEIEALCTQYGGKDLGGAGLFVSELVKRNTDLRDKQLRTVGLSYSYSGGDDYEYDSFFTKLKEELEEIQ